MYCNCLLMTRTWELGPILGNLDPYSETLNLTRTRLCTKVPEYNTLKKSLIFCIFLINVLNLISTLTIGALLLCHVSWVIGFESGLKKIDFTWRY
jgi:hypothetical protein